MFKIGDKVVCIEGWRSQLTAGKTYTISRIDHEEYIFLDGIDFGGWAADRFELKHTDETFHSIRKLAREAKRLLKYENLEGVKGNLSLIISLCEERL